MPKFQLASLPTYSESIATTMKSRWVPLVFLFPLIIYFIFRVFETELTHLIIPLFPDESDKSFGFYNDFLHLCFNELLWLSFFLFLSWIFLFHTPLSWCMEQIENYLVSRERIVLLSLSVITIVSAILIARYTLKTFPNSADEYVYLYQAETLSEGKLTEPAHPLADFFQFNHIAQKDGISVGRFPPGWPVLLSIAFIFGFPSYLVNPVLAVITLLLFYQFANRYYGKIVALWSTLSLCLTAYFLFNAGSYFSHISCMLFAIGFVYAIHRMLEDRSVLYPIAAGVCLGCIMVIRYYNAALFFLPVMVSVIYFHRWRSLRHFFLIGVGAVPFLLSLMWYDFKVTGNALLPVTMWADSTEAIGFVKGHTFIRGVEYTIRRLLLFLYWCSPAILVLYAIFLMQKITNKAARFAHPEDYFLLILIVGYFFYYHLGGNQYGPRFFLEALPFAIVFVINRTVQTRATWSIALLAGGMTYAVVKFPYIIKRESQVVNERIDPYVKVKNAGISNAVVIISTHTGVIRPMPPNDLTRNHSNYEASVLYALDRGKNNKTLMEYYSGRTFYKYVRNREKVAGRLIRIK